MKGKRASKCYSSLFYFLKLFSQGRKENVKEAKARKENKL